MFLTYKTCKLCKLTNEFLKYKTNNKLLNGVSMNLNKY